MDEFILIGFGKEDLSDMLKAAKESQQGAQDLAAACTKKAPRYRTLTACSLAQQKDFVDYMDFMKNILNEES